MVVVIGAGIAGLNVARRLAEQGKDVTVLEKDDRLDKKVCGGGIDAKFYENSDLPKKLVQTKINRIVATSENEKWDVTGEELGTDDIVYIVDRGKFDAYLGKEAERAGAKIETGVHAKIYTRHPNQPVVIKTRTEHTLGERIVKRAICAEGPTSGNARRIGLDVDKTAFKCYQEVWSGDFDKNTIYMYLQKRYSPDAYAWVFPTSQREARVGVGTIKGNPVQLLDRFKNERGNDFDLDELKKRESGLVSSGAPVSHPQSGYVYCVGDCVNQVDAMTGAGNELAMQIGDMLADVIISRHTVYSQSINQYTKFLETRYRAARFYRSLSDKGRDAFLREMRSKGLKLLSKNKNTLKMVSLLARIGTQEARHRLGGLWRR